MVGLIFKNGFQTNSAIAGTTTPQSLSGGDGTMTYAYYAKGRRYVETVVGGATTRYCRNGYEKVTAGTTTHRHELGRVIVSRVGSTDTVRCVHRLGSTVAISEASAALSGCMVIGTRK